MRNNLDNVLRKYMRAVKHNLICPKSYRDQFSIRMKEDLEKFVLENDTVEYEEIIQFFGTPSELAQFYLNELPSEELNYYKIKRKYYITISIIILAMVLFSIIIFLSLKLKNRTETKTFLIHESIELLDENIE